MIKKTLPLALIALLLPFAVLNAQEAAPAAEAASAAELAPVADEAPAALEAPAPTFKWTLYDIDGHRTGVTIPMENNISQALGTVEGKKYIAPNLKFYKGGCLPEVVRIMTDVQATMAPVKEVIGYATNEMKRYRPQCELSNWFTDFLRAKTAELTGKQVDVAIYNFGGIRADMPQGPITVDDIMSMFPFRNTLCYVRLKGSDLRAIFDFLAATEMQAFSGAKVVVKDKKIVSIEIGGKPLDNRKEYGVATINFLLTGGDDLFIAKNALELIDSGVYVMDAVIPYVRRLSAESTPIEGRLDDRITIIGVREEADNE